MKEQIPICCKTEIEDNLTSPLPLILKFKLANMILGTILLILGLFYKKIFPENAQVGDLMIAASSFIVSLPILIYGLKGFLSKKATYVTEQLVSIAVLASISQKDFISATLIPIFMVIAHFLEEKSIMGVKEAISGLKKLYSKKALKLDNNKEILMDSKEININDTIICYPGESIPLDGKIIQGSTMVDQASITGESMPVSMEKGAKVFAGTMNLSGKVLIKVTEIDKDTILNRVMKLLVDVEKSKTPIEKIIEKYIALYLPFIITISAITLFITQEISRSIAVLVISCPCALILATPTAMIASLVIATKKGIMIKNSSFLETLSQIKIIAFDKTGTITTGKLSVIELNPEPGINKDELLLKAGISSAGSTHPVSSAITGKCQELELEIKISEKNEEISGKGVISYFENKKYMLGKKEWITGVKEESDKGKEFEEISVWIKEDDKVLGNIIFSDSIRSEVRDSLAQCRSLGIEKIVLFTGDKTSIGEKIGAEIGADEILSECLPEHKLDYVNKCREENNMIMTVGDGINDALALSASNIGVSIGSTGSDIAIQSSDITLKKDNLMRIPEMFILSSFTRKIIHQNILIGTGFSIFMLVLAIAGLITPLFGALFHNIGSIFVVLNSSRILKIK